MKCLIKQSKNVYYKFQVRMQNTVALCLYGPVKSLADLIIENSRKLGNF